MDEAITMAGVVSERKSLGLYVLAFLMLINAAGTTVMYFRILGLGAYSNALDLAQVQSYAWGDLPFTVIPQLFAALGIHHRKSWGFFLALMVCAIYLHSMTVLIAEHYYGAPITPMFYIDFYFFAFAAVTLGYLFKQRRLWIGAGV